MAIKKIKIGNTSIDVHDARDVIIGDGVGNVVALTTAQYEALTTKDATTTYIITDSNSSSAENVANKVTSISSLSTDTQYPSAKLLYDKLALKQGLLTFDNAPTANSSNPVKSGGVYAALADKYELPASGIPLSDMSNAVQTSLDKADTALQSANISNVVLCASQSAYDNIQTKDSATLYLIPES